MLDHPRDRSATAVGSRYGRTCPGRPARTRCCCASSVGFGRCCEPTASATSPATTRPSSSSWPPQRSGWPGQAGTPATTELDRAIVMAAANRYFNRVAGGSGRAAGLRRTARPLIMGEDGHRAHHPPHSLLSMLPRSTAGPPLSRASRPGARAERSGSERKPEGRGGASGPFSARLEDVYRKSSPGERADSWSLW